MNKDTLPLASKQAAIYGCLRVDVGFLLLFLSVPYTPHEGLGHWFVLTVGWHVLHHPRHSALVHCCRYHYAAYEHGSQLTVHSRMLQPELTQCEPSCSSVDPTRVGTVAFVSDTCCAVRLLVAAAEACTDVQHSARPSFTAD